MIQQIEKTFQNYTTKFSSHANFQKLFETFWMMDTLKILVRAQTVLCGLCCHAKHNEHSTLILYLSWFLLSLGEKCPYLGFFRSAFSRIRTKYGPEKIRIRKLFTQCTTRLILCVPKTYIYVLDVLCFRPI